MSNKYLDFVLKETPQSNVSKTNDPDILFQFSLNRRNVIEWYPFESRTAVLEIGAGAGIITKMLCERGLTVDIIEQNEELLEANLATNKCNSIQLQELIENKKKYHYIVLVGGVEGCYGNGIDSFERLIALLRENIEEDGTLILGVENRYAVSLLARGYDGKDMKALVSKNELEQILHKYFSSVELYYPSPDLYFANTIYSDNYLPKADESFGHSIELFQDKAVSFNESVELMMASKDGLFPLFANSYLAVCS